MSGLLVTWLLGVVAGFESWDEAAAATVPSAPIVLYVSRADCTFCAQFEKEVLGPVLRSEEYSQLVFREFVINSMPTSIDFGPLNSSAENFADTLNIVGTPTVLFFDRQGREIAKRYVGFASNDYASFIFERSLKEAMANLKRPNE